MKNRKVSLGKELIFLCAISFLISFLFYILATTLVMGEISLNYNTKSKIERLESKYIQELQTYIDKKEISIQDIRNIDDWVKEKEDVYLKLFYQGSLLYDTIYGAVDYKTVPAEAEEAYQEIKLYHLNFQNEKVEAAIFCYDFRVEGYVKMVALLIAFILFFGIILFGIRKKVHYLYKITSELNSISKNLNTPVTLKGADEITEVAYGINHLRITVIEKLEKEKEAYQANMNLVTALSHDIKTPLTSVIAYMELAKENVDDKEEIKKCLDISLDKALHLKKMVNELFEHFLLHSNRNHVSFEKVNANELIMQMLEENLFDLESRGVLINRSISDISSELEVNVVLVQRLFDNLFSNINKYADLSKALFVRYVLEKGNLIVSIRNYKRSSNEIQSSTKIGLNNCRAIMEKHGGKMEVYDSEKLFEVTIYFPLVDNN